MCLILTAIHVQSNAISNLSLERMDSLKLYNVITPNGDGQNDVLFFDNLNENLINQLFVVNQWGNKVYEDKSYNNDWDGRNKSGDPLPAGNYYYILKSGSEIFRSPLTIIYD